MQYSKPVREISNQINFSKLRGLHTLCVFLQDVAALILASGSISLQLKWSTAMADSLLHNLDRRYQSADDVTFDNEKTSLGTACSSIQAAPTSNVDVVCGYHAPAYLLELIASLSMQSKDFETAKWATHMSACLHHMHGNPTLCHEASSKLVWLSG